MQIRTFAWSADQLNPEHVSVPVTEAGLPAYLAKLEAGARGQGFSFAVYNGDVLPWALVRYYNAVTGQSGTTCEHVAAAS